MDEWSGREKGTVTLQFVVIGMLLVTVGMQEGLRYDWDTEEDYWLSIAWMISVEGDNYIIEIVDVSSESLDRVRWEILDRLTVEWEDPSGEAIRLEGDLIDINFSMEEYRSAPVNNSGKFYSRDPSGSPPVSNNHTLCIVYMDVNHDGKLSNGDVIWIRSTVNGGCADEDFRFRMVNDRTDDTYGEKILVAV